MLLSFKWLMMVSIAALVTTASCGREPTPNEREPNYQSTSHAVSSGPAKQVKKLPRTSLQVWPFIPSNFARLGNLAIFTSGNELELWRSDGTREGTFMLRDIWVGPGSSNVTFFAEVNGGLFFSANDGLRGTELWKTDGTPAGTVLVKDIWPGSASSSITSFANMNDTLFFCADDGVRGEELWKSDGTEAGTTLIAVKRQLQEEGLRRSKIAEFDAE